MKDYRSVKETCTAEKILKKKQFIKAEMDRQLRMELSNQIWKESAAVLTRILRKYADIPDGIHAHTDVFIFPSAAIYLTAQKYVSKEQAYSFIENAAAERTEKIGRMLAKIMALPFMRDIFLKMMNKMTKKKFGKNCGFQNRFYPKKKGEYRMDILACPYCKYFTELGCPELTKIFCENDERGYGNLPGLKFERNTTLGKDGDRCDFCFRKTSEKTKKIGL
ncbi:MAG: L-2-amino-thiazoline-4-carboxylic acid hydrolase [Oscillospiraceae bacterium]|nr:L-2-amino-thiazoline-4-carboxylic acid hydrolase [Oscillospiraceae bacterium]